MDKTNQATKKGRYAMKIRVLELGATCLDKATMLEGTLTHWILDMEGRVQYIFQPKGLDDEGQPVKKLILCEKRLDVKGHSSEEVEVPFEILGTLVTDRASGFTGMAIEFIRHINGCFHIVIQPEGTVPGKNKTIQPHDFDLRACTGEKIVQMSNEEMRESKERTPSPTNDTFQRTLPNCIS